MKNLLGQKVLVASVLVTIVFLISLVGASLNLGKYKKGFRDEMALRLDLEEKLLKIEKERQDMRAQLVALKTEASSNIGEVEALKEKLKSREDEIAALNVSSARSESQLISPMQK